MFIANIAMVPIKKYIKYFKWCSLASSRFSHIPYTDSPADKWHYLHLIPEDKDYHILYTD